MSATSLAARQKGPDYGRYLYLYNNIRTKQIVYSLSRSLDVHQLPIQYICYLSNNTSRTRR
jgi:hypothetical protein